MCDVSVLLGKTLISIKRVDGDDGDELHFGTSNGEEYKLYHEQDCCEGVHIEDICGDLADLLGSPLLEAEETSSHEDEEDNEFGESSTWTFYKFATIKGCVTVRWLGTSNGYYSESVHFKQLSPTE